MKKILNIIVSVILIFAFFQNAKAQDNIIYNMQHLQQSINDNPAQQSNFNLFIGLPALSHHYINVVLPFTYSDALDLQGNGKYGDFTKFRNDLKDVNYFNVERQMAVLDLGFWVKNFYFTIGYNEKMYSRTSFPKSIFDIVDGNYRTDGTSISFSDFGYDFTSYTELHIGLSKEIIPNLTVGTSLKFINGLANFTTKKFKLDWTTSTDPLRNFAYTFDSDFEFRSSSPITWNETLDSAGLPNGFEVDTSFLDNLSYSSLPKNRGFGIDLGAIYKINDLFTVSGSVIDLGTIKWKTNTKIVTQNSSFEFDGADVGPYVNKFSDLTDSLSSTLDDYLNDFVDTLITITEPTFSEDSYSTALNTKIFLGGTYTPKDWLSLGVLYRGYFWDSKLHSALTFSATTNFWKGWSFATSYGLYNGLANNIGLGLAYKIGWFQCYSVMDNIAVPYYAANKALQIGTKGAISPNYATKWMKNSKEINLHFGVNILIGKRKGPDYGLLD